MLRALVLAVGMFVTATGPILQAQSVVGTVVDRATSAPVSRGFVVLIDSLEQEVARWLVDDMGRYRVRAPGPGTYRLRSERIGYRLAHSPPLALATGETIVYGLVVDAIAIRLDAIEVQGRSECRVGGADFEFFAAVWAEAQKALRAASWTANSGTFRYDTRSYVRVLNRGRNVVRDEQVEDRSAVLRVPFRSIDPGHLVENGYVVAAQDGGYAYYAPDPDVLLDERFLEQHCVTAVKGTGTRAHMVALTFEPISDRFAPDIAGQLWLDGRTSELQTLEYRYSNLPVDIDDQRIGGTVAFTKVGTGAWIVREWQIRMPLVELIARRVDPNRIDTHLVGFQDVGSVVTRVIDIDGRLLYAADFAWLDGRVVDGTRGTPLTNARVTLVGTNVEVRTDGDGRFSLAGSFDGTYQVLVEHPRLDTLGYRFSENYVHLTHAEKTRVGLETPTLSDLLSAKCGAERRPETRVLVGVVQEGSSGQPVPDAIVRLAWYSDSADGAYDAMRTLTVMTDSMGAYVFCEVPSGRRVGVTAEALPLASDFAPLAFLGDSVRVSQRRGYPSAEPVWKHDFVLRPLQGRRSTIVGTVRAAGEGEPVPGARVQVANTDLGTISDSVGAFQLVNVSPGTHQLVLRRLGFAPTVFELTVPPATRLRVPEDRLVMGRAATQLSPIIVEADQPFSRRLELSGFYRRRERGFGEYLTPEEWERWNPSTTTDVMRRLNHFIVRANPGYGRGGDYRRFVIALPRGQTSVLGVECPVVLYVDGVYRGKNDIFADLDFVLDPGLIAGIEAYHGAWIPPRFSGPGSTCGVIVIWTR